jgi:hypothetical protein
MEQQLPLSVPPDRRSIPRFDVEFRTLVSNKSGLNDQLGIILDLSLSGCQVRVPILVYPGLEMELRISTPDLHRPIFVEKAAVQWVKGDTFGLQFLALQKGEFVRLGWVVARLSENGEQCGEKTG